MSSPTTAVDADENGTGDALIALHKPVLGFSAAPSANGGSSGGPQLAFGGHKNVSPPT